ncbi:MAG: DUF4271 domain-containing protein, partial [Bacteroidales bacterium]|nr:DUF4271 domain-containing protein [Bacteroidales bacterium]
MHVRSNAIDFFSAAKNITATQDTVITQPDSNQTIGPDTISIITESPTKDTISLHSVRQIDFAKIDSILKRSEERERQIQEQVQQEAAVQSWYRRKTDTTEILYKQFGIAGFPVKEKLDNDPFQQNFLYNIVSVKPVEKQVKQNIFIETQDAGDYNTSIKKEIEIKPRFISGRIQFDWITILLIGSFLLLGWIRVFNKKYLVSLIKSVVSYQESNTLYREKNSLTEKASFMVNLLFISNISVFVIQLKHFFSISLENREDYILYFIVFGALTGLYIFRAISTSLIGFVFLKQKVFSEFFHNINIFTKNTGLFLLPIVIPLQFLSYEYLAFIIYTGIILIALLYLLQIVRSFQIIIRKNASIFYMILYLCAFEFAPFLI